ncbi:MAG: hypothetical protein E7373_04260 [Clostridiales bacterium]|nr:hypothetical protein [Clostridiales bacterium]
MKKKITEEDIKKLAKALTDKSSNALTIEDIIDALDKRRIDKKDLFLSSLTTKQRELYDAFISMEQAYNEFVETFSVCFKH